MKGQNHAYNRSLDRGLDRDRFRDGTPNLNRKREKQPEIDNEEIDVDGENPQVRGIIGHAFGSPSRRNDRRQDMQDGRTATPSTEEEMLLNRLNEVEKENALLRLERENQPRPRFGNMNNQRVKNLLVTGDIPKRRSVRPRRAGTRPAATQQSVSRTSTGSKCTRNDEDDVRDRYDEREFSHDYYARSEQGRNRRDPTGPRRKRNEIYISYSRGPRLREGRQFLRWRHKRNNRGSPLQDDRESNVEKAVQRRKIDRLHRSAEAPSS
ncbi:pre-mRNA-splicing factor 38B-like [Papaver somniferum]|uniref:pre-mRNA-splicing factor 38B-like n=1 Tax=Papaver somniferum TaxID=3469 RepID=UPI000E6F5DAF|nr:pre-mRNA-splicing factor 38B-like [Papaver somniferum]